MNNEVDPTVQAYEFIVNNWKYFGAVISCGRSLAGWVSTPFLKYCMRICYHVGEAFVGKWFVASKKTMVGFANCQEDFENVSNAQMQIAVYKLYNLFRAVAVVSVQPGFVL